VTGQIVTAKILPAKIGEDSVMLSPEHISEATSRLVARAGHPAKVILIGSYAKGDADDASDLDVMVVDTS
jgi:predicted nucleotidyltransferase